MVLQSVPDDRIVADSLRVHAADMHARRPLKHWQPSIYQRQQHVN